MISTTTSSPAAARLARAKAIFSGLSSSVVTRPPVERAASASQMVEKALEVPTSRIRVAPVARTMIEQAPRIARDVEHALGAFGLLSVVILSKLGQLLQQLKKSVVHASLLAVHGGGQRME